PRSLVVKTRRNHHRDPDLSLAHLGPRLLWARGQDRDLEGLRGLHFVDQQPALNRSVLIYHRRGHVADGLVDETEQAQLHRRDEKNQPERAAVAKEVEELFAEDGDKRS